MKRIFLGEMKLNLKTTLLWSFIVGILGFVCTMMYKSMQGDMKAMADMFSNMGAFSDAFGMSTLSIATIEGFFATEVGTVHGLGGGMFAAILAIGILSKEEEGHTGEFLFSLPVSRIKVIAAKGICVLLSLIFFTIICALFYALGFVMLNEEVPVKELVIFMLMHFIMNVEVASICFALSSISGKNRMGLGIGIAMMFYVYDLIGRVVPSMKDYLFLGPYSYTNASEIFAGKETSKEALLVAAVVLLSGIIFAFFYYDKRDLAS